MFLRGILNVPIKLACNVEASLLLSDVSLAEVPAPPTDVCDTEDSAIALFRDLGTKTSLLDAARWRAMLLLSCQDYLCVYRSSSIEHGNDQVARRVRTTQRSRLKLIIFVHLVLFLYM